MSIQKKILSALNEAHLILVGEGSLLELEKLCEDTTWKKEKVWLAHATKLDDSDLMYFLPEVHDGLKIVTGVRLPYVSVETKNRKVKLRIVGMMAEQPFGPFWDGVCQENMQSYRSLLSGDVVRYLQAGREIQENIGPMPVERSWREAAELCHEHTVAHRKYVYRLGDIFEMDVDGHDLTKTWLIQIAMGWFFHLPDDKVDGSWLEHYWRNVASDVIAMWHYQREDYSPAFRGPIDASRLFLDVLARHLRLEKPDGKNGWGPEEGLPEIPEDLRRAWKFFRDSNANLNLYFETLDLGLPLAIKRGAAVDQSRVVNRTYIPTHRRDVPRTNPGLASAEVLRGVPSSRKWRAAARLKVMMETLNEIRDEEDMYERITDVSAEVSELESEGAEPPAPPNSPSRSQAVKRSPRGLRPVELLAPPNTPERNTGSGQGSTNQGTATIATTHQAEGGSHSASATFKGLCPSCSYMNLFTRALPVWKCGKCPYEGLESDLVPY